MWLINYVTKNSIPNPQSEKGNIKSFSNGRVQVNASSDFKHLPVVAPYGIAYVPPIGCQTAVMPAYGGEMCMGTISNFENELEPGEVMLYSSGGATLALKNDGNVYINGVKFSG